MEVHLHSPTSRFITKKAYLGGNLGNQGNGIAISELFQRRVLPANMTHAELDDLFAACMPRLRHTARRMLRDPRDCEDALQDGLLLAFRNLDQFQGRAKFSTWLHSIVRNSALALARKTKSRPQFAPEELFDEDAPALEQLAIDPGPRPDHICARREKSRILLGVLQELPARYYSSMRLCYVEGIELKDAAERLGITVAALKTNLFRARRLVTRRIRERCIPGRQQFFDHDTLSPLRARVSPSSEQIRSISPRMRTDSMRCRMRARARQRKDLQGGSHEFGREPSGIWENSLAPFVRASVCNGKH
jgi:RNA polymerase sigma-70 factor, ECF subfamily